MCLWCKTTDAFWCEGGADRCLASRASHRDHSNVGKRQKNQRTTFFCVVFVLHARHLSAVFKPSSPAGRLHLHANRHFPIRLFQQAISSSVHTDLKLGALVVIWRHRCVGDAALPSRHAAPSRRRHRPGLQLSACEERVNQRPNGEECGADVPHVVPLLLRALK